MNFQTAFFEDNPALYYAGKRPQTGSSNFLDFFDNRFNQTYNKDYAGQYARQLQSGQNPQSFVQYMDTTYDPWAEYRKLSPQQRGENRGQFAPRTRWNIGG